MFAKENSKRTTTKIANKASHESSLFSNATNRQRKTSLSKPSLFQVSTQTCVIILLTTGVLILG
jgi:hypothetical protein